MKFFIDVRTMLVSAFDLFDRMLMYFELVMLSLSVLRFVLNILT